MRLIQIKAAAPLYPNLHAGLACHGARLYAATTAALAMVWAVNFLIVLPLINPQFVDLVPYTVSFVSKILFGLAAAATLHFTDARRRAVLHA